METAHLSQLMLILCQFNPELTKSMPTEALPPVPAARPGSMYSTGRNSPPSSSRHGSISSRRSVALVPSSGLTLYDSQLELVNEQIENDSEVQTGHNFTFIPPQPRKFYKRLLELCIQADLEAMANLPEDQEVSLGILSQRHLDLLNECALRWRIGHSYRVTCFLDVIKYKYEREEVPMECIPEGLQMIGKAIHDLELKKWPRQDVSSTYLLLHPTHCVDPRCLGGLSHGSLRWPLPHVCRYRLPHPGRPPQPPSHRTRTLPTRPRRSTR